MGIRLDLHFADEETLLEQGKVFLPITPDAIQRQGDSAWTVWDLEKYAFETVPSEFSDVRAEIGKRLERLGEDVILHAYGPVEGDYYIDLPAAESADA